MAIVSVGGDRRTAVAAGVFLVLGAALLAGWLVLNLGRLAAEARYHAVFADVTGLATGAEVRIAGFTIGTVRRITVAERTATPKFRVDFAIDPAWPVPADSRIAIASASLLGAPVLALRLGTADTLVELGGKIATETTASITDQADTLLTRLTETVDTLDRKIVAFFDQRLGPTTDDLRATVGRLDQAVTVELTPMLATLRQGAERLDPVIGQAETSLDQIAALVDSVADQRLAAMVADGRRALRDLRAIAGQARRLVATLAPRLETGATDAQFSLQILAHSLGAILVDLERASGELAGLATDLRRNPAVIFGRGD